MAVKKQAVKPAGGRQAAYTARNRAALIKAGQEVLAKIGPLATIEQLSEHAQVSPTTIYNYFENKENLFAEALSEIWESTIAWANQNRNQGERLEVVLDTGRKLLWAKQHDPFFAKILQNILSVNQSFAVNAVAGEGRKVFKELAASGAIKNDDFEKRWVLWANILAGLFVAVYVTEELKCAEAETAMGYGLSIWGISEAKAKKIVSRPLNFAPVQ
jgi:AcrR family transcriptional regulator